MAKKRPRIDPGALSVKRRSGGAIKSLARINYEISRLGKLGAASKVRVIDPSTVDLSKYGI